MDFDEKKIQMALACSWSLETAAQWRPENPALGQCNVTALIVQELFGGKLLKTRLPEGEHFYNFIDGQPYDFTDRQFLSEITYEQLSATRSEAEPGASASEQHALCVTMVGRASRFRVARC